MSCLNKIPSLMALLLAVTTTATLAGQKETTFNSIQLANAASQVCGTDENKQNWGDLQQENKLQLQQKQAKNMFKMSSMSNTTMAAAVNGAGVDGRYYIPVVVHVYGNEFNCTSGGTCLTESKIIDALNKTNEDFLGTNTLDGPISAEFAAIRSNLNIEFVLAKRDPSGNVTNGIVRYGAQAGYGDGSKFDAAIAADAWDNFKYMNIYVMTDLYNDGATNNSGVAWYPQLSMSQASLSRVVYNGAFMGSNINENSRSIFTHEFGHWLNLPHTFAGDVCSVHQAGFCSITGDNNCDTPQMSSSILQENALNCLGKPTNTENFMHYSNNYAMYTEGQVSRMTAALHGPTRSPLWSNNNLIAVGLSAYTSNAAHSWDGSGLDTTPSGQLIIDFTNLSGLKGETNTFTIDMPVGTEAAAIYLKGFDQDPDLYVSKGVAPSKNGTDWVADFISFKSPGTPELITLSAPSNTQSYYATIDAFTDYSNATLEVLSVDDPSLCTGCERIFLAEETNLGALAGSTKKSYQFQVPSDATRVVAVIAGGYTGDPDMYVSINSVPTTTVSDCGPWSAPRLSEFCEFGAGGGTVNVMIDPFLDYSEATFRLYYERIATVDLGLPVAEANGAYNAAIDEVINFSSAGSVDSNGHIVSFYWDFGDGNSSTLENPSHAYTSAATFTAMLTITDNDGNQATDSSLVNVLSGNTAPTAQTDGPYAADAGQLINFSSAGSFDQDGSITSYLWSFGDSNTSALENPSHSYQSAGDYQVSLTVTDNNQASTTVMTSATIAPVVVSNYCSVTGNTGYEWIANVTGGGISHDSSKEGYADNTAINMPLVAGNNTFSLTAGGSYSEHWAAWVDLNQNGIFDASEKLLSGVSGKGTVSANLVIPNGMAGVQTRMRVVMTYGSAPSNACGNLGDGEAEDYTVTITGSENIAPTAVANGDYSAFVGDAINFISMGSKDTDGTIVSYLWTFGDNNESADANPIYSYTTAGNYSVSLTVTDNDGASHTDTAMVVVSAQSSNLVDACASQAAITGGSLTAGVAACLSSNSSIWLSLGDVSSHQSVAITTGHGQGNLDVLYSNSGWPSDSSYDGKSLGNGSTTNCITLPAGTNYWSYLKVTGGGSNATILVEFDSAQCK